MTYKWDNTSACTHIHTDTDVRCAYTNRDSTNGSAATDDDDDDNDDGD